MNNVMYYIQNNLFIWKSEKYSQTLLIVVSSITESQYIESKVNVSNECDWLLIKVTWCCSDQSNVRISSNDIDEFCFIFSLPLTNVDPQWIGAWWLSYIISGCLTFCLAIPLFGYGRELPCMYLRAFLLLRHGQFYFITSIIRRLWRRDIHA